MNDVVSMEMFCGRHDQHDRDLKTLIDLYHSLNQKVTLLMSSQSDLATALTGLSTKLDGFKTELTNDIANLQTALNNQGGTTPEVDAALAALSGRVDSLGTTIQSVDALAPGTPTPTPTDTTPAAT